MIKRCLPLIVFMLATAASAHEFWLEPDIYRLDAGDTLTAHIKIGEYFEGDTYAYLPQRFETFELVRGDGRRPVGSRLGDLPAVRERLDSPGLAILTYASTYQTLTYDDARTFQDFLALDGLRWAARRHSERGLQPSGFTEAYRRFAKSYIGVGAATGADRALGYPLEWVLEGNPYEATDEPLRARLLWRGEPAPDRLARVFLRTPGSDDVEELRLTTDTEGRIRLPYRENTEYLINSVHLAEPPAEVAEEYDAVWESFWASATFWRE